MVGGLLTTALLRSTRFNMAAGAAGAAYVGSEAIRSQEEHLRAWYGDSKYEREYAKGINAAQIGVTALGIYGGASALLGRKFAGVPMPLGANLMGKGLKVVGKGALRGMDWAAGIPDPTRVPRVRRGTRTGRSWMSHDSNMLTLGVGALVAGSAIGIAHGLSRTRNPMIEARHINMAPPTSQRLNYSTIGLTQALHDRRKRTL